MATTNLDPHSWRYLINFYKKYSSVLPMRVIKQSMECPRPIQPWLMALADVVHDPERNTQQGGPRQELTCHNQVEVLEGPFIIEICLLPSLLFRLVFTSKPPPILSSNNPLRRIAIIDLSALALLPCYLKVSFPSPSHCESRLLYHERPTEFSALPCCNIQERLY